MKTLYYISISDIYTPEQRIFGYAFTYRENAEYYADEINRHYLTKTATVCEAKLPFIGRSVCYVKKDSGIGSNFYTGEMYELYQYSPVYSCTGHAKSDELWQGSLDFFKKYPDEKKHETESMIATDYYGEPFSWGNYCGFVTTIERIRVIKAGEEYILPIDTWNVW